MFCGDTHVQRSNMASVTQHTMIIHTAHESRKLYPSSKAKQLPQAHVAEETETSRSLSPSSFSCQASHALLAVTHQSIVTPLSHHLSNDLNHCKVPSILRPLFPHSLFLHKTMLKLCCSVLCRPVLCHLLMPLRVRTGGLAPLGW